MLNLLLIRVNYTPTFTEGYLIDEDRNVIICNTVEDHCIDANMNGRFDGDEVKVYGESAIPFGEYKIEVTHSPKFGKDMVLIKDVPHFTGIRIHFAYNASYLLGCLGVGKKIQNGTLKNTGMTDKLVNLLYHHKNKGKIRII